MYQSTIGMTFEAGTEEIEGMLSFPGMMGKPDKIEVTTQKDTQRKYVPGLKDPGDMDFVFGYEGQGTTSNWAKFKALEGKETEYKLTFPDGSGFKWLGMVSRSLDGKGIAEASTFTVSITPTGDIEEFAGQA